MKKSLFVWVAIAMGVALAPGASAGTLTFDHINATYTLKSDDAADVGPNVSVVNAYIENTSTTASLAITGFEYYLGGTDVTGAAGDTPAEFVNEKNSDGSTGNGWTYSLGKGAYSNGTGTAWPSPGHNSGPTAGGAVKPEAGSTKSYLSAVTLENGGSTGICSIDETLAANNAAGTNAASKCEVELLVTANYGGALGSSIPTFIYGYAEGVAGTGTFNPVTGRWSGGSNAAEAQGMEETIYVDVAPEPGSLLLLGTGMLALAGVVRRKLSRG